MNVTIPKKIILTKIQIQVLSILGLLLVSGGVYTAATHQTVDPIKQDLLHRVNTVDIMMQKVDSSDMGSLKNAQYQLRLQASWGDRQAQTEDIITYKKYLESCNQVLIAYSKGKSPNHKMMNELKKELI